MYNNITGTISIQNSFHAEFLHNFKNRSIICGLIQRENLGEDTVNKIHITHTHTHLYVFVYITKDKSHLQKKCKGK